MTESTILIDWKRLFFNGPTVVILLGAAALVWRQDEGIARLEEAVTREVVERNRADTAQQAILEDIRDELVHLRRHYLSISTMLTWCANMEKANPGKLTWVLPTKGDG